MEQFSIGILSWHSTEVLVNTLKSYHDKGLITDLCQDTTIYFQEITDDDVRIANHFGVKYMGSKDNIGIGQAMVKLASTAKHEKVLLLEHDWELIESLKITQERLDSGLKLLDFGYDCIRYRHREKPGFPHFSEKNYSSVEKALAYVDPEIQLPYPHLLDSVHWLQEPDRSFRGKIGVQSIDNQIYYVAPSKYANWTNNPCLYRKDFYINATKQFAGKGIELEGKISHWWGRQNFNVAHGEGLFKHNDFIKHPHARV